MQRLRVLSCKDIQISSTHILVIGIHMLHTLFVTSITHHAVKPS